MNYIPDIADIGGFNYSWDFDHDDYLEWLEDNEMADTNDALHEYIKTCVTFTLSYVDHETLHSTGDYVELDYEGVSDEYGEHIAKEMTAFLLTGRSEGYVEKSELTDDDVDINNPDEVNDFALKYMPHGVYRKGARGFILTNGEVVYTESEHNECTIIPGVKGTSHFIRMGNIRVLDQSIDLGRTPTPEQKKTLIEVISSYEDDVLYVDFLGEGGEFGVTYTNPQWRVVINEIERFFRDGIKPTGRMFGEARKRPLKSGIRRKSTLAESKIRRMIREAIKYALLEISH